MKDLLVIDNAVPASVQDLIRQLALSDKVAWHRNSLATYPDGQSRRFPVTADALDTQQFTHSIYEINQPTSQFFATVLPVISAIPYTIKQLIRIKMNLGVYCQQDNPGAHGMPHVDFTEIKEPLLTAIYYVNDSSGDTLIFDQRLGHQGPLTVRSRVTPKKGRLVVFDGSLLHAGNTPRTNSPRVNINFNAFFYEGAREVQ